MTTQKQAGYWEKRIERFNDSSRAQRRAGILRLHDQVSHVLLRGQAGSFTVAYSVAKWYADQLKNVGIEL